MLDALGLVSQVLYVDDGSRDGTWMVLQAIAERDRRVRPAGRLRCRPRDRFYDQRFCGGRPRRYPKRRGGNYLAVWPYGAIRDLEGIATFDMAGYFRAAVPPAIQGLMVTGINVPVRIGNAAAKQRQLDVFGEMVLADLPVPVYAPIWSVEDNRIEFLGPATHPEVTVARAVRMAVALPLFFQPVELDDRSWCDGGIVDIFPVAPFLDIEPACDVVIAVNGFYPAGFAGEPAPHWAEQTASILRIAAQVRSCQHVQLARDHLRALQSAVDVVMIEPVPFEKVRGIGFYRQFIDQRDWPSFMRSGRDTTLAALNSRQTPEPVARAV